MHPNRSPRAMILPG